MRSTLFAALLLVGPQVRAHPEITQQIERLDTRIEREPDNGELYLRRGELHRIHQDWAAAEADFVRAEKLGPTLPVGFHRGRMQLEAGRPAEAEKTLDRFLAGDPGHVRASAARARAKAELGQHLDAAKDYTTALAGAGKDAARPAYYLGRARALAAAGAEHLDLALRGIDEGLKELGHPVTLELYAVELELMAGRPEKALARLDAIAARSPRKEKWLLRKAEILEEAGRTSEAREHYVSALAAIEALPDSRRWNRAVMRIQTQAEEALDRLDGPARN